MANIVIDSFTGNFVGTSSDDVFVFTAPSAFAYFSGSIDGLGGNDTLMLVGAAQPEVTPVGPLTELFFDAAALNSIEAIDYSSNAGERLIAQFQYGQLPDGTTLVGGAGRDGVVFIAWDAASTLTVPFFSYQNWNASDNGSLYGKDYIFVASVGSSDIIINARDNVPGVQV